MTWIWLSFLVAGVAVVALAVVAASGLGPLGSLRRTTERLSEVREEAERLRRNLDVLERRADELRRSPGDEP